LLETGANDVLAVRRDEGGEMLIPYTGRVVLEVDRAGGRMVVDWGSDWI